MPAKWRVWDGAGQGGARAKLAGQGFFAKAITRATGRDGSNVGRTGDDRVFEGFL